MSLVAQFWILMDRRWLKLCAYCTNGSSSSPQRQSNPTNNHFKSYLHLIVRILLEYTIGSRPPMLNTILPRIFFYKFYTSNDDDDGTRDPPLKKRIQQSDAFKMNKKKFINNIKCIRYSGITTN